MKLGCILLAAMLFAQPLETEQADLEASLFEAYNAGDIQRLASLSNEDIPYGTMRGLVAAALGEDAISLIHAERLAQRACDPRAAVTSAEVIGASGATRLFVINEAHHLSHHRATVIALLPLLREAGFTHFLFEGFLPERRASEVAVAFGLETAEAETLALPSGAQRYMQQGALGAQISEYKQEDTLGARISEYSQDPVLARLLEAAVRNGFVLEAFEQRIGQDAPSRRAAMASNIKAILDAEPEARLVVLTGHSHGREDPGFMTGILKDMTGLDPLTLGQTVCAPRSHGQVLMFHHDGDGFDYVASHRISPNTPYAWRRELLGDETVDIGASLEAELLDVDLGVLEVRSWDGGETIPLDRVLIKAGVPVRPLFAPPMTEAVFTLINVEEASRSEQDG